LLKFAVADYVTNMFKPYRMYFAVDPIRKHPIAAERIHFKCNQIISDSYKYGRCYSFLVRAWYKKLLNIIEDVRSRVDTNTTKESILINNDLTEPDLKTYLLSITNDLRKQNANIEGRWYMPPIFCVSEEFISSAIKHVKQMSDLCRDEESIIKDKFDGQDVRLYQMNVEIKSELESELARTGVADLLSIGADSELAGAEDTHTCCSDTELRFSGEGVGSNDDFLSARESFIEDNSSR